MKKVFSILLELVLTVSLSVCGNASASATNDAIAATVEPVQNVEVDEGLLDVTVTIPADFLDSTQTQADYDAGAVEGGYKYAALHDDGSVTYVMSKKQHKDLLAQVADALDSEIAEMLTSSDYPNFVSIDHNEDFTEFRIVSKTNALGPTESLSPFTFYMYSMMYNVYAGNNNANCHIEFVNEDSGEVFSAMDSSEMQSVMAGLDETEPAALERDLSEGDYEEMGPGTVSVSTPGGTSVNGNVPVLYADSDSLLIQIGLNAWNFNGGALSYVYIDGILNTKEQLANTQTVLSLSDNALSEGIHTVEVVQYENDDPSAEMTVYKSMQYEVKLK